MRSDRGTRVRLAIVGCGAVTRYIHFKQARRAAGVEVVYLVDPCIERAEALAAQADGIRVTGDYREVVDHVDAALVATPHWLHAAIASDLLSRGIHVLVEKPMAMSTADCDGMMESARAGGAVLAVALIRRYLESTRLVKEMIDAGLLGAIESFDLREGFIFDWDVASDSLFRRESGGVLIDTGSHALDQLLYWLGDWDEVLEYRDDAFGGIEADCEIDLRMRNGATGHIELSRTRDLPDRCVIRGDRAVLEVGTTSFETRVCLRTNDGIVSIAGHPETSGDLEESVTGYHRREIEDFAAAILAGGDPTAPGAEGRRAIELIEACYAARRPLRHPWVFTDEPTAAPRRAPVCHSA